MEGRNIPALWTVPVSLDRRTALGEETYMEIPQIEIHEAKERLDQEQAVFVDIRDPASYRAAHIPGALHLHDGNVQDFVQNTDKEKPVVVYCYHGNSSLGAAAYFLENGFKNVASMSGGFEAWRQVYHHEAE
jgi:thiosulfate sulfurtransferase